MTEAQPAPDHYYHDETLRAALDQAGIAYEYHQHHAVFSVEESQALNDTLPEGAHVKNLFLKDRKAQFYLLCIQEEQQVNLKELGKVLGARGGLSFAREALLWQHLGVRAGSVTPLAILNAEVGVVQQYIDETVYQSTYFHVHPLRNDRTITVQTQQVVDWLVAQNYPIARLDFRADPPQIIPYDA